MAMSSYFGGFRLRQPLAAEIGAGISGGSVGNPDSPAGSGDAADASCTGAREVSSNMTTGEMAGQTALNPPRLTTVAWPPARLPRRPRLEHHGRLSSEWLPAVYLLAVAARGGGGICSAAEPVKR